MKNFLNSVLESIRNRYDAARHRVGRAIFGNLNQLT